MVDAQDVAMYQSLTPRQHVLKRAPIYAGDCVTKQEDRSVYVDGAVLTRPALTNDGLQKLFDEAMDNAVDNAYRDPPTTVVRVRMDATTFQCANNGAHIPVQQLPDGQHVASTIFFKMFSGSNFDDEAGREAAGASATAAAPRPASPPSPALQCSRCRRACCPTAPPRQRRSHRLQTASPADRWTSHPRRAASRPTPWM